RATADTGQADHDAYKKTSEDKSDVMHGARL
ncbi:MAG: adenylate cyclase, partial [Comamonadaceae bacterium]